MDVGCHVLYLHEKIYKLKALSALSPGGCRSAAPQGLISVHKHAAADATIHPAQRSPAGDAPEEPSGAGRRPSVADLSAHGGGSAGVLLLIAAWLAALVAFGMWQAHAPASEIGWSQPARSRSVGCSGPLAPSASLALLSV